MKQWLKIVLFTALVLIIGLIVIIKVMNIKVASLSNDIDFTPALEKSIARADSITRPKNVIIFVADGMGFSHLALAMHTQQEGVNRSVWQRFDVRAWYDSRSTFGSITDSGASATAFATGTPTFFDVIGQDPDGNDQENVFEMAQQQGYTTGIVTDSYFWDATPAAFVAHTISRDNAREIQTQMASSELDLLFGELEDLGEDGVPERDETMEILKQRFQLLDSSLELPEDTSQPIMAIYEEDEVQDMDSDPNLPQLTELALEYLTATQKPLMLMVECEEMDSASHRNDSERVVKGLESLQQTLSLLMDYAEIDGETLLLFLSDHETGGLSVLSERNYPSMQLRWGTKNHTAAPVPLFAYGPGSELFQDVERNWQAGQRLKELMGK